MAVFGKSVVTDLGVALQTKLIASGEPLVFTKMEFGDGAYVQGEDIKTKTGLKSRKQSTEALSVSARTSSQTVVVYGAISSTSNPGAGYRITEAGVFALDPDLGEILYSLAFTTADMADLMPDASIPFDYLAQFVVKISNVADVTVAVDPSIVYVTRQEWDAFGVAKQDDLTALQQSVATHLSDYVHYYARSFLTMGG